MRLFDADKAFDESVQKNDFETSYESIADRFNAMFDMPIPLVVETIELTLQRV